MGGSMGSVVLMKTGEGGAIMETFEGDATDSDAIHTFVSGFIDPVRPNSAHPCFGAVAHVRVAWRRFPLKPACS